MIDPATRGDAPPYPKFGRGTPSTAGSGAGWPGPAPPGFPRPTRAAQPPTGWLTVTERVGIEVITEIRAGQDVVAAERSAEVVDDLVELAAGAARWQGGADLQDHRRSPFTGVLDGMSDQPGQVWLSSRRSVLRRRAKNVTAAMIAAATPSTASPACRPLVLAASAAMINGERNSPMNRVPVQMPTPRPRCRKVSRLTAQVSRVGSSMPVPNPVMMA